MEASEPPNEESVHTFHWTQSQPPSSTAVLAIAEASGEDPAAMEPLYNVIDPDSLDTLFTRARSPRLAEKVQFEYYGYRITITADGNGFVHPQTESNISASSSLQPDADPL